MVENRNCPATVSLHLQCLTLKKLPVQRLGADIGQRWTDGRTNNTDMTWK